MKKTFAFFTVILALAGVIDAGYLTYEHYNLTIPPCSINIFFADCGKVLNSSYALIMGVPLALIGLVHYTLELITAVFAVRYNYRKARYLLFLLSSVGLFSSLFFIYLQLFIIGAVCLYCMVSALISTLLFMLVQYVFVYERKMIFVTILRLLYTNILKKIFFLSDPEKVHNTLTSTGQFLGKTTQFQPVFSYGFSYNHDSLKQNLHGITFKNPIGLAAGFDYEAKLTQVLPKLGFGFGTVGTITNNAYDGNPRPMLGRLPQSRSLMVNKGFKNLGAEATIKKLSTETSIYPVGISIGRTNGKKDMTQKESIKDIVEAFMKFEKSKLHHTYYELNISCPNLLGNVSFYPPKNLKELLTEVDTLKIKRPIFVKMPIEKSDREVLDMLEIIAKHGPKAVIFGNLQKNRNDESLMQSEVQQFTTGNFSGKPTFTRSNELISLAYRNYRKRFTIIGTGGVFSAEDAYEKIQRGASLVQLITGMIYNGPQLVTEINLKLVDFLKRDGYKNISETVGTKEH